MTSFGSVHVRTSGTFSVNYNVIKADKHYSTRIYVVNEQLLKELNIVTTGLERLLLPLKLEQGL